MRLWPKHEEGPQPPIYVGSHEDRLRRIRPIHFTPDDEGHTREDKERERAAKRVNLFPWGAWSERDRG